MCRDMSAAITDPRPGNEIERGFFSEARSKPSNERSAVGLPQQSFRSMQETRSSQPENVGLIRRSSLFSKVVGAA